MNIKKFAYLLGEPVAANGWQASPKQAAIAERMRLGLGSYNAQFYPINGCFQGVIKLTPQGVAECWGGTYIAYLTLKEVRKAVELLEQTATESRQFHNTKEALASIFDAAQERLRSVAVGERWKVMEGIANSLIGLKLDDAPIFGEILNTIKQNPQNSLTLTFWKSSHPERIEVLFSCGYEIFQFVDVSQESIREIMEALQETEQTPVDGIPCLSILEETGNKHFQSFKESPDRKFIAGFSDIAGDREWLFVLLQKMAFWLFRVKFRTADFRVRIHQDSILLPLGDLPF